jgi:phosphoribosyl 1,2-cyclic phosphodiesterase
MTAGTAITCRDRNFPQLNRFSSHDTFTVGALQITPFPVPHDAKEPVQFVFSDGNRRLGHLTDLGESTPHVVEQLVGCDALFIEANHDVQMLADGPYPAYLQARVGGRLGHMSNDQSAALLAELVSPSLQHLVAAHLSEKNNHPDLALAAFARAMGCEREDIGLATQDEGIDWRQLD